MGLFSHFEEREKDRAREREERKRERREVRGVNSSPFIETNIRSTVAMCILYFCFFFFFILFTFVDTARGDFSLTCRI